jgi:hypothetical protein
MQPHGWPAYLAGFALAALLLIFPVAVDAAAAPAAKPTIYEFGRKLCPICRATEAVLKDVEARYPGQITLRNSPVSCPANRLTDYFSDPCKGLFKVLF